MVKMLYKSECCAVKEDTYKVMIDDYGKLLMLISNKDKHTTVVLAKEDAVALTRTLMNTYEGELYNV